MELLIGLGASASVLTYILKEIPQVPVNSDNALVVVLVLVTLAILLPAYLDGGLTLVNADLLASSITLSYGMAVGLYESWKKVWALLQAKMKTA